MKGRNITTSKGRKVETTRRRGSVLILVITLLSVLFVLGVAFMATMNFEAELLVSESQRRRARRSVEGVVEEFGSILSESLSRAVGRGSAVSSSTATAELPADQSLFGPIEPYWVPDPPNPQRLVFGWSTDANAQKSGPSAGLPREFVIDTAWPSGTDIGWLPSGMNIRTCLGGIDHGLTCDLFPVDSCLVSGGRCVGYTVVDADGDGIVDTVQVEASKLGMSPEQIAAISEVVNGSAETLGHVFVGLRVIPHGGMVNLNESHPRLIQTVFNLPLWPIASDPPDPNLNFFVHRPTQTQVAYSTLTEEPVLRRRALLPPADIPATRLHGDRLVDPKSTSRPNFGADMAAQLFPPAAVGFQTVLDHRYWSVGPAETHPFDLNFRLWDVRMEPFESFKMDPTGAEYDRRHLVTTVSHDDQLSRGEHVQMPNGPKTLREMMFEANQASDDPLGVGCVLPLPFEFADYPHSIPNNGCDCPTNPDCRFDFRKGRLRLSLPWLDDAFSDDGNPTNDLITEKQRNRLIHDAFMMLVRNATQPFWEEVIECRDNGDCPSGLGQTCEKAVGAIIGQCACANDVNCQPGAVCQVAPSGINTCAWYRPYWEDKRSCIGDIDCRLSEQCEGACVDPVTQQRGTTCKRKDDPVCPLTEPCEAFCVDRVTLQRRSLSLLSRTAASLTANMVDYEDADDIPTRVALRSFDFAGLDPRDCQGGGNAGEPCRIDGECPDPRPGTCRTAQETAGFEFGELDTFGNVRGIARPVQYVYGLERQPFITEIATCLNPGGNLIAWGVELFNPHDEEIVIAPQYFLMEDNPSTLGIDHTIALSGVLKPGKFTALVTGPAAGKCAFGALVGPSPTGQGTIRRLSGANQLTFQNGWTIYLVRRLRYLNPITGMMADTDIVVDQFEVKGPNIAQMTNPPGRDPATVLGFIVSVERVISLDSPSIWTSTVPVIAEQFDPPIPPIPPMPPGHTLGSSNNHKDAALRPVEARFANTGSFTLPDPGSSDPAVAFPTTGSMFMLVRHANRSLGDRVAGQVEDLAFTTWLDDKVDVINSTGGILATLEQARQIDNGRMPVFDQMVPGTGGLFYSAHHVPPRLTPLNEQGGVENLPWGQLVFDYFTALPLSSDGPYRNPTGDINFEAGKADSVPRVDLEGLRVYGRIDLNAAPWTVLQGLPFVPMEKIPPPFRPRIKLILKLNALPEDEAGIMFQELAKAIVAYREQREILPAAPETGDYSLNVNGRGWGVANPAYRRGTGFLTVGELANVRHAAAVGNFYRADSGELNAGQPDYVNAIAVLAALGDWMTVRSHVATVYGTIRGDEDRQFREEMEAQGLPPDDVVRLLAEDIASRAIRFQETLDRLPTLMGAPAPIRIGERVVGDYQDVHNN